MGTSSTTQLVIDNGFIERVLPMVKRAEKQILVCTYAWRLYPNEPDREIQKLYIELCRAIARGVSILVISDKYNLLRELGNMGFETRFIGSKKCMHAKAILIDQKELIVGSHNLTARANEGNRELSIYTTEFDPIFQFVDYFHTIWSVLNDSYSPREG